MGLKDGTLKDLLLDPHLPQVPDRDERVAKLVIRHMLQALDFLSVHGIVHRDVKPENILYTRTSGVNEDECLFQLGDFGLSNHQSVAKSVAGTEIYMAPGGQAWLGEADLQGGRMVALRHRTVGTERELSSVRLDE